MTSSDTARASLAQTVEQPPRKVQVAGSIPAGGSKLSPKVELRLIAYKIQQVVGATKATTVNELVDVFIEDYLKQWRANPANRQHFMCCGG